MASDGGAGAGWVAVGGPEDDPPYGRKCVCLGVGGTDLSSKLSGPRMPGLRGKLGLPGLLFMALRVTFKPGLRRVACPLYPGPDMSPAGGGGRSRGGRPLSEDVLRGRALGIVKRWLGEGVGRCSKGLGGMRGSVGCLRRS